MIVPGLRPSSVLSLAFQMPLLNSISLSSRYFFVYRECLRLNSNFLNSVIRAKDLLKCRTFTTSSIRMLPATTMETVMKREFEILRR